MFYVYVDWTREEIPRPFYVGKGTKRRTWKKFRNHLHKNISLKYGQDRRIEFVCENEQEAHSKEIELISRYKTYFHDPDNWGANFTRGGEGTSGGRWKLSENTRKKQSLSQKGRVFTEEHRKNMSISRKGKGSKKIGVPHPHRGGKHSEKTKEHFRELWKDSELSRKRREAMKLGWARRKERLANNG